MIAGKAVLGLPGIGGVGIDASTALINRSLDGHTKKSRDPGARRPIPPDLALDAG